MTPHIIMPNFGHITIHKNILKSETERLLILKINPMVLQDIGDSADVICAELVML